ncbi:2-polyprenyl-6-methoxyphenol hydroxylase [Paraburkholderia panacisoli]|uniref:2-polyprenyl-6-methoxyphenol hydroxylase n=1 Tax=Paraburkholderia panacisoli TaxID=2603818 RepID=A0A5B0GKD3_9BURK|nr:FAD-dependent monooxygenase [Paraburkholderia panacisoli]KAA1003806.1 2-polyprenyl-6-methoxyphenol hydroxylase [Paraburkholderia panacisoli]
MKTQVVIVGAGPVGLTLAIDLGMRGIECLLVEQKAEPQFLPKMERCNARTMEIFRRLGIADRIRAAGMPQDVPMDIQIIRSMTEPAILRLPYPSVAEARLLTRESDDGSLPLEPYQLISQYTLEPLLLGVAEQLPTVTVMRSTTFLEFTERAGSVLVTVKDPDGVRRTLEAAYLVGCDGGASRVRKQLGIRLEGEGDIARLRQGLFYCEQLYERLPMGNGPRRGRHYLVAGGPPTFMIMQDSTRHWTIHSAVESDEEMRRSFERIIGVPLPYDMLHCGEWRQNLLLAERYGKGRVFLAGDAAHLVIPTGGLGMNTGVGDATDLAWKLAATLQGWGGPGLLASYEAERRQIGERVVGASRYASLGYRAWLTEVRPEIADDTPAGASARAHVAEVANVEQRKSNEMIGAELGYRYVDSSIIDNVPGGPQHDLRAYLPTTWPGARLPHMWLNDGSAIQDRLRSDRYTLIDVAGAHDAKPLRAAFEALGAPLDVLVVPDSALRAVYERDLILVRPDMHVAWRGDRLPQTVDGLASRVTGHSYMNRASCLTGSR